MYLITIESSTGTVLEVYQDAPDMEKLLLDTVQHRYNVHAFYSKLPIQSPLHLPCSLPPSLTSLPPSPPSLPHLFTQGFMETSGEHSSSYPPTLIIILSRLVHDMERSTISYLVRLLILVSFPDYMGENKVAWE